MGWTKRAIVEEAFSELALAGYVFDLTAEEMQTGLRRLDLLMATWGGKGINLGYAQGLSPDDTDLDQESGLPIYAIQPAVMNLALSLAAAFGKVALQSTREAARDGMEVVSLGAAFPPEQQLPGTMPRGAGNKPWRTTDRPFMPAPDTAPLQIAGDGGLQLGD